MNVTSGAYSPSSAYKASASSGAAKSSDGGAGYVAGDPGNGGVAYKVDFKPPTGAFIHSLFDKNGNVSEKLQNAEPYGINGEFTIPNDQAAGNLSWFDDADAFLANDPEYQTYKNDPNNATETGSYSPTKASGGNPFSTGAYSPSSSGETSKASSGASASHKSAGKKYHGGGASRGAHGAHGSHGKDHGHKKSGKLGQ